MPADYITAADRVIFRMHADYSKTQPTPEYREVLSASWAGHLYKNGVPHSEIMPLYEGVLAAGTNGFLPTVDQLLAEWQTWLEGGYWEQQNQYEPDYSMPALMPGEGLCGIPTNDAPAFVQAFAMHGPVVCHCPGDRHGKPAAKLEVWGATAYWQCASGKCDFRADANTLPPSLDRDEPAAVVLSEQDLLDALFQAGFDWPAIPYRTAIEFARYATQQAAPERWDFELLAREWDLFQERAAEREYAAEPV